VKTVADLYISGAPASVVRTEVVPHDLKWLETQPGFRSADPDAVRSCVMQLLCSGTLIVRAKENGHIPPRIANDILSFGYPLEAVEAIWGEFAHEKNLRPGRCRSEVRRRAELRLWLTERARRSSRVDGRSGVQAEHNLPSAKR
jgi:hypothetical protein